MIRDCDVCGGRYQAKRATSRYCSDRCRKRAQRAPAPVSRALTAVPPLTPQQLEEGPLTRATLEALEEAEVVGTALGQAALLIARKLEAPSTDTGSSIAALIKVHREVMQAALDRGKRGWSPLEDIRDRYNLSRASAGLEPIYYDPRA